MPPRRLGVRVRERKDSRLITAHSWRADSKSYFHSVFSQASFLGEGSLTTSSDLLPCPGPFTSSSPPIFQIITVRPRPPPHSSCVVCPVRNCCVLRDRYPSNSGSPCCGGTGRERQGDFKVTFSGRKEKSPFICLLPGPSFIHAHSGGGSGGWDTPGCDATHQEMWGDKRGAHLDTAKHRNPEPHTAARSPGWRK